MIPSAQVKFASYPNARQRGFAAVVLLVALIMGALYALLTSLNTATGQITIQRDEITQAALKQAKEALIAYAALRPTRPGGLPCPDLDDNGVMGGNHPTVPAWNVPEPFGVACNVFGNRIGRLPWRTLDLPDLRDSNGERLWYALSNNFRNIAANPINSDTNGQLTVTGLSPASNVVAIIFAPGDALGLQNRSGGANANLPANYLEGQNGDAADDTYAVLTKCLQAPPACPVPFNDQLILITQADLFNVVDNIVAKRIENEIVPPLENYRDRWATAIAGPSGIFPFAVPFDPTLPSADNYCGVSGQGRGLLPVSQAASCINWSGISSSQIGGNGSLDPSSNCITAPAGEPDSARMIALKCTLTYTRCGACFGPKTPEVRIRATLDKAAMSLAVPLDPPTIVFSSTQWGSIASQSITAPGNLVITYEGFLPDFVGFVNNTVTITLPIYSAPTRYRQVNPATPDTAWFFDNEWYRVTYYAVASTRLYSASPPGSCTIGTDCLTVNTYPATYVSTSKLPPGGTNNKEVLLVLAGHARAGITRPSTNLADYFEGENLDSPILNRTFEQRPQSAAFNDKAVVVAP